VYKTKRHLSSFVDYLPLTIFSQFSTNLISRVTFALTYAKYSDLGVTQHECFKLVTIINVIILLPLSRLKAIPPSFLPILLP